MSSRRSPHVHRRSDTSRASSSDHSNRERYPGRDYHSASGRREGWREAGGRRGERTEERYAERKRGRREDDSRERRQRDSSSDGFRPRKRHHGDTSPRRSVQSSTGGTPDSSSRSREESRHRRPLTPTPTAKREGPHLGSTPADSRHRHPLMGSCLSSPPTAYYECTESSLLPTQTLLEFRMAFSRTLLSCRQPTTPTANTPLPTTPTANTPLPTTPTANTPLSSAVTGEAGESPGCRGNDGGPDQARHCQALLHPMLCCNEATPLATPTFSSNSDDFPDLCDWHCYALSISPGTNFTFPPSMVTALQSDGRTYFFRGFSVLSTVALDNVPPCIFTRYGGAYQMELKSVPCPQNFLPADVWLFQEYLFVQLLELHDWASELLSKRKQLLFLPCFSRDLPDGQQELLSVAVVLRCLLEDRRPISTLASVRGRDLSQCRPGLLLAHTHKRPRCLRMDRLKWSKGTHNLVVVHVSSCHQQAASRSDVPDERNASRKVAQGDVRESGRSALRDMRVPGRAAAVRDVRERGGAVAVREGCSEAVLEVASEGLCSTGLHCDVAQLALTLPLLASHLLFHCSWGELEKKLAYHFSDRRILQCSLTHPSFDGSVGTSKEDVRVSLSNCGLQRLAPVTSSVPPQKRDIMSLPKRIQEGVVEEANYDQGHYEQLEFLGDAILEYLSSLHLFHLFPLCSHGDLNSYRRALVKNAHLFTVASRLQLARYLRVGVAANMERAVVNCLEALIAAVYLDGDLGDAQSMLARVFFPDKVLCGVWLGFPPLPLQQEHPDGDRHFIATSTVLKNLVPLEERLGVTFTHIRLLAKAFTHSSVHYDNLTRGNYQRLEFLGDAVLQFLTSLHVFRRFPTHSEGVLTVLRTSLVRNKLLVKVCTELGLQRYIRTSSSEEVTLTGKILADVVEAYLAALLLDKGLPFAQKFLEVCLFPRLTGIIQGAGFELVDANTRLMQAVARLKRREGWEMMPLPVYRPLHREGTLSKPQFTVGVYIGNQRIGTGTGLSMKEARARAAEKALASGQIGAVLSRRSLTAGLP